MVSVEFGEIQEQLYSLYPVINFMNENWVFALEEVNDGYVVLTVYEVTSADGDYSSYYFDILFTLNRKWDGRSIFNFGHAERHPDAGETVKLNSEVYVWDNQHNKKAIPISYKDIEGTENFLNIILLATKIANQCLAKQNNHLVEDEMTFYPVTERTYLN